MHSVFQELLQLYVCSFNPNGAGLECGGFDFLKVCNELGKVNKFQTARPPFLWRNSAGTMYIHHTIRVKKILSFRLEIGIHPISQ